MRDITGISEIKRRPVCSYHESTERLILLGLRRDQMSIFCRTRDRCDATELDAPLFGGRLALAIPAAFRL